MATFNIITNSSVNNPPYQTGVNTLTINNNSTYTFTVDDFTINTNPQYADPEGDPLLRIKILHIFPDNEGVLKLNGVEVNEDDEILASDITLGLLTYTVTNIESRDIIYFDVADTGSQLYGGLRGEILIDTIPEANLPPTIGNGEVTIDYGETIVFTREMFTTQTTPPYNDPEGDAAHLLKIVALPNTGIIKYNNILVYEGQNILFTDIDAGLLTYTPDPSVTGGGIEGFEFGISDAGSGQFTY